MLPLFAPGTASSATFTVNSTADRVDINPGNGVCVDSASVCTLRAAIQEANALAGIDTITLNSRVFNLDTLTTPGEDLAATGDLDITESVIINGAGQGATVIDGGDFDRVFHITGAYTVTLSKMTIRNGNINGSGGGIFNSGALTLDAVTVTSNTSTAEGGGIYSFGTSVTILNGSVISNNTATTNGGCIWTQVLLNLTSVTLDGCTASGLGGGLYVNSNTTTVSNSTIQNNTAGGAGKGGGIYVKAGGVASVDGTRVLNNSTEDCVVAGTLTDNGGNTDSDGTCLFAAAGGGTTNYTLDVTLSGDGLNGVSSDPAGIDCPGTCSATFTEGQVVSLTKSSGPTTDLSEWGGACDGVWRGGPCEVTMDSDKDVIAYFTSDDNGGGGTPASTNNPPSVPGLLAPPDGSTFRTSYERSAYRETDVTFKWNTSTDADGDEVSYQLWICDNNSFAGCDPINIGSDGSLASVMGVGAFGAGIALFGFGFIGRRRVAMLIVAGMLMAGGLTACGSSSGSSDETATETPSDPNVITYTATLSSGTYYWKVTATDSNGGSTTSETRSFTTGA